jgi:hypothetical protein
LFVFEPAAALERELGRQMSLEALTPHEAADAEDAESATGGRREGHGGTASAAVSASDDPWLSSQYYAVFDVVGASL